MILQSQPTSAKLQKVFKELAVIFSVFYKQLIQYSVAVYVSFTITLRNDGVT